MIARLPDDEQDAPMNSLTINVSPETADDDRAAVLSLLQAHNRLRNGEFYIARERPENAARPLDVLARDGDGRVVGGLFGETQFRWLKVTYLAVAESARRRGVGTELMRLAEVEAVARGCRYAFLDTMSYQAPDFYQKLGYEMAGRIDD